MGKYKKIGKNSRVLRRLLAVGGTVPVVAIFLLYNSVSSNISELGVKYKLLFAEPSLLSHPKRNTSRAPPPNQKRTNAIPSILRQFEENNNNNLFFPKDSNEDSRPILVICGGGGVDSYDKVFDTLHMFSNFTILRLLQNQIPPPFNTTNPVFLHGENCKDHPYVVESMERRKRSPYLVSMKEENWTSSSLLSSPSSWVHGVHWPNFFTTNSSNGHDGNANKYLRVIHERPAILKVLGEVFWRQHYRDVNGDFVVYREVETLIPNVLTIHFLQGVSTSMTRGWEGAFGFRNTTYILQNTVAHPHKRFRDKGDGSVINNSMVDIDDDGYYKKFCSFVIRFNSTNLIHMFNNTFYDTDALVRHMFFRQLSKSYKPCERVTNCSGNPYMSFKCMVGYKFHITMENTNLDGYVSEKLFNGALAGGIPIYFGASNVGKYTNKKSFVHCDVNKTILEEMRSFYPRTSRPRHFLFNRSASSSSWPTDEELYTWADGYLRPELEPCVRRVMELDGNDELYEATLREPFLLDGDIMSGAYPLRGVMLAYNLLSSSEEEARRFGFRTLPPDTLV
mmetsp:Transcript_33169/g.71666  ORF Transcript_33169/g.71666 Transcript_33169/m.71666 type:complete len:564 (+) Transcript_33169:92-1783(+)